MQQRRGSCRVQPLVGRPALPRFDTSFEKSRTSILDDERFRMAKENLNTSEIIFVSDDGENLNASPHQYGILECERLTGHRMSAVLKAGRGLFVLLDELPKDF